MRRHELASDDDALFREITGDVLVGYLGLVTATGVPRYACPATQFFKPIEIRGTCRPVEDIVEKARALQALMEKHQPEGGYDTIDPSVPQYSKALAGVGVYRVQCDSWSGKVKFGQNEPEKLQRIFVEKLRERNRGTDEATAQEIEGFLNG